MRSEPLELPGASGGTLSAHLDLPAGAPPTAYALLVHSFTDSQSSGADAQIGRALGRAGIATLRLGFSGPGEGEADPAARGAAAEVADLVAAAEFLEREHAAPRMLVGHSLGGAALLLAAARIPSAAAVATIGAPFDEAWLAPLSVGAREEVDGLEWRLADALRELRLPLLILHSPLDEVVAIESASRIFAAARHPKSFISLDHADHRLSDPGEATYVGEVLGAWGGRYLTPSGAPPAEAPVAGEGVVARIGPSGYRTEITVRGHTLVADEPVSLGGMDTGPTPYDLLLAAVGSCTAITMRMYADRKGWPMEGVAVRLSHRKVHAEDCEHCEEPGAKIDRVEKTIDLEGPLTPEQAERLREIAGRCPVRRTLANGVQITSAE